MFEVKIYDKYVEQFKKGYPLIFKEAIMGVQLLDASDIKEGTLLKLVDERGKYLATGYYGRQNKGYGWVLSKNDKEVFDHAFFQRKIYLAIEKRLGLFNNPKTNAFRVFNGEGDGIGGLTIDFLNGYYLINYYSKGIYSFNAHILSALKNSVEFDGIYEKMRFDHDHVEVNNGLVLGNPAPESLIIKENDVKFRAFFDEGAMTGIFLDQREVRRTLKFKYARGKDVLNLFSYTGAFSVFAALGGAKSTTSVDLANRSYDHTKHNFELNNLTLDHNHIIVEDVFHYFKFAAKKNQKFDVVIIDPPSFAKSKDYTFSAERDYPELLADAIQLTHKAGVIVASNNSSNISLEKFKQIIGKGFNLAKARFEILEIHQLPKDFRTNLHYDESNYLKVVFVRVLK